MTVFVFDIGGCWYGLPVEAVAEVLPMAWVTPVPESPPDVAGVLDVRGQVVTIVDPTLRLGLPRRPSRATDFLVLVSLDHEALALRVDGVLGLVSGEITPAPLPAEGPDFLVGHLRTKEGLASVLALDRFLRPDVREFALRSKNAPAEAR